MIESRGLRVTKAGRVICRPPDLEIAAGERTVVTGPNGSGKTTLLRVLAGLEGDYQGLCRVAAALRERVLVGQKPCMFRGTALANVLYGLRARGVGRAESRRRAVETARRLGVDLLLNVRAGRLSGGEQRRVALARAIVLQPQLLLLDEPLADLDPAGVSMVGAVLAAMPAATTVLIASPSPLPPGFATRSIELSVDG